MEPPHSLTREQVESLTIAQADAMLCKLDLYPLLKTVENGDAPHVVEGGGR